MRIFLTFFLSLTAVLAQTPPYQLPITVVTQKWFGHGPPAGGIGGNQPGDFYTDVDSSNVYQCSANWPTMAPACTAVKPAGWVFVNSIGSGLFSSLPGAAGPVLSYVVTDCATSSCSAGGGSLKVLMVSDGSAWAAAGSGGGGGLPSPAPGVSSPIVVTGLCSASAPVFTGAGLNDLSNQTRCDDSVTTAYDVVIDGVNVANTINLVPNPTFQVPADWTTDNVGLFVVSTGNATYTSSNAQSGMGWCGDVNCDEVFLGANNTGTVYHGATITLSYTVAASSGLANLTCADDLDATPLDLSVGTHQISFVYHGASTISAAEPDIQCSHTGASAVEFTNLSMFQAVDTFKWSHNGSVFTTDIQASSNYQQIGGNYITFASAVGHTLGDQWTFTDTVTSYFAPDTSGGINIMWPPFYGSGSGVTTTTTGTTSPGTSVTVSDPSSFSVGQGIYIAGAGPSSGVGGTIAYSSGGTAVGTGVVTLTASNGAGNNAIANVTVTSNTISGNLTIVSPGLGYTSGAGLPTNWTCAGNVGTTCSGTVVTTGGSLVATAYTGVIQSVSGYVITLKAATSTSVSAGALVQHDESNAVNTAISYLTGNPGNPSGGRIFFPCGTWHFNGPLLNPGQQNAIIPFPSIPSTTTPPTPSVPLTLSGEVAPGAPQDTNGCTIFSTISTGGSVFAAHDGSFIFTAINLVMEKITFSVPLNPAITVIDASAVIGFKGENLLVTNGQPFGGQSNKTNPTNPNGRGILLPAQSNNNMAVLRDSRIAGLYTGLAASEHAVLDNVEVVGNAVGLQIGYPGEPGGDEQHPVGGTTVGLFNNGIGILAAAQYPVSIQTLEIENDEDVTTPTATYICYDPSNLLYGIINYYNSPETAMTGTPFASGCTNIKFFPLDNTFCTETTTPIACGSANRGAAIVGNGAATQAISTTAITATSQVIPVFDSTLGGILGVTCSTAPVGVGLTAKTAGTSFTLSVPTAAQALTNCVRWSIVP